MLLLLVLEEQSYRGCKNAGINTLQIASDKQELAFVMQRAAGHYGVSNLT